MYITQAYKGLHDWWRYIIGVIIAILGVFAFSLPHVVAIIIGTFKGDIDQSQMNDTSYVMGLFEPNLNLVFILLPFAGGLLFLLLAVKYLHKQSLKHLTTTRKKIDWKRFWFIFFLWGIVSSSFVLIDYVLTPEDYVFNFKLGPFLILCVIAIALIPLQTSFEEYLFRGYLMQGIGIIAKNKWVPLVITSLVFGVLHIANPEVEKLGYVIMVYYIGTGLVLGIMTLMDEGMELALGFHAANNLFTALLVTADWTAFQTHSIFKDMSDPQTMGVMEIFVPVFVVFPILLFILSKKYKWTNWKDKLFGTVTEPPNENYKIIEDIGSDTRI
ncbi:CPBP family intramembrane glutamic endopeptidase [Flavivirga eckloniae]|uniref:CPBP family intramembrane metalloprotease domain-containing protein n=1 Tax=Flavivirga eckloniae TaxID=1803846 RepID=A0A2K9PWJ9_9FLAO|nr:CPBP family intramembrane glutamic endopeptidase [Flavivirga eckloniae]AUP81439.1 CPBP family intramembrane metalloprotease domain-containing protein [Flavivirga eckloniae]